MKIATVSDLHLDDLPINRSTFVDMLCKEITSNKADLLLMAGDISSDYRITLEFIDELTQKADFDVRFVPGNHDLWNKNNGFSTDKILNALYSHKACLIKNPLITNEFAIIGHIGWYDYSFAVSGQYTYEKLSERENFGRTWKDKLYVDMGATDTEVSNKINSSLEAFINCYQDKNVILVTHMISNPAFLVPSFVSELWGYFNSFLGSTGLCKLTRYDNVKYAVCGHVHYRRVVKETGKTFICACLGYECEWDKLCGNTDLAFNLKNAIIYIE